MTELRKNDTAFNERSDNFMRKLLKTIWNRKYYGKPVHIAAAIAGFGLTVYSVYWIGRSDEINQILDIVQENGSVTLNFWSKSNEKVAIYMTTD